MRTARRCKYITAAVSTQSTSLPIFLESKINSAEPKVWLIFGLGGFCREFQFFG